MTKTSLGLKIVLARKESGITQAELAKRLFTAPSVVNHWEKDKFRPSDKSLQKLSQALQKPRSYFYGEDAQVSETSPSYGSDSNSVRLPIFDMLPAGFPDYNNEDVIGFLALPRFLYPGAAFAVQAKGSSITGKDMREGDYCIIKKDPKFSARRPLLIKSGSHFLIKTFNYKPNKSEKAVIIGRVTGILRQI